MAKAKSAFAKDPDEAKTLMQVALGEQTADLVVINARLANVYTGEILDNFAISTKGRWIAYVGPNPEHTIGSRTEVIDAGGQTVIPGLIDGHAHLSYLFSIDAFLNYAFKGGTTTIVTETMEIYPVAGYEGLLDLLESFRNQPIKILATAPAMISISHAARGIPENILAKLLKRDDIIGLGESYWQAVLQEPDQMMPLFNQTLLARKTLEGHSAGASEKKLAAYIANGITSCHEPINADQVLERLRLGLHIMIREGAVRKDLAEIAKINTGKIDLRRLILVTDGVDPAALMAHGYMENVVQKAIDCGFQPMTAIQMATLNVATHFGLDHLIGGIAPGRYADLVILPDIFTIDARTVISNGQIIAQDKKIRVPPRKHAYAEESLNTIHLPRELLPADFAIKADRTAKNIRVRAIKMVTDLVTAEEALDCPVVDGHINANPQEDLLKISAIDRTHNPGRLFSGLLTGFGQKAGAFASSTAWDTSDIVVAGADDTDMATAANRIRELQGGTVVCKAGKILAEIALPVFGVISELTLPSLARRLEAVNTAARDLGVPFPNPVLSLITLTGAAIPYLRICEEGLVNLKDGQTRALFID